MSDLVSVIIPVYNSQETIKKCLDSILNNTYKNVEIIIIDDFSSDQSSDICLSYKRKFVNVKFLQNEENKGVSYTRNVGLNEVKGKYIIFIDSDDWIEPKHIETLVRGIKQHSDSLTLTGYINDDSLFNNRITKITYGKCKNKVYNLKTEILSIYDSRLIQQLWNKIFISEIIYKNKIFFDEKMDLGEDEKFIYEYIKCGGFNNISIINECYYHYMRINNTSLMQNITSKKLNDLFNNLEELLSLTSLKLSDQNIQLQKRRSQLLNNISYMVYHNPSLSHKEKKAVIYQINPYKPRKMYNKHRQLYFKEKIAFFMKRGMRWIKK